MSSVDQYPLVTSSFQMLILQNCTCKLTPNKSPDRLGQVFAAGVTAFHILLLESIKKSHLWRRSVVIWIAVNATHQAQAAASLYVPVQDR